MTMAAERMRRCPVVERSLILQMVGRDVHRRGAVEAWWEHLGILILHRTEGLADGRVRGICTGHTAAVKASATMGDQFIFNRRIGKAQGGQRRCWMVAMMDMSDLMHLINVMHG